MTKKIVRNYYKKLNIVYVSTFIKQLLYEIVFYI